MNNKIEMIVNQQRSMWHVLEVSLETGKRLEQKIDSLITLCNQNEESPNVHAENDDCPCTDLIYSLPLGVEDFFKLDQKIATDSHFKRRLVCIFKYLSRKLLILKFCFLCIVL